MYSFTAYGLHPSCDGVSFFFFNDTATTEIYTLSLHDALPISRLVRASVLAQVGGEVGGRTQLPAERALLPRDRKSTRLNSSHITISYAVFCLKKKKKKNRNEKTKNYKQKKTKT